MNLHWQYWQRNAYSARSTSKLVRFPWLQSLKLGWRGIQPICWWKGCTLYAFLWQHCSRGPLFLPHFNTGVATLYTNPSSVNIILHIRYYGNIYNLYNRIIWLFVQCLITIGNNKHACKISTGDPNFPQFYKNRNEVSPIYIYNIYIYVYFYYFNEHKAYYQGA